MRLVGSSFARLLALLAVGGGFACSSEHDSPSAGPDQGADVVLYDRSPIVFGALDRAGMFGFWIADGRLEQLNRAESIGFIALSPSRRRMLVVHSGFEHLAPQRVDVYDVAPFGAQLASDLPGGFLGWVDEETLLFANSGIMRVDVASGKSVWIPFPDWVTSLKGGALSPDRRAAAFAVFAHDDPAEGYYALIVLDTETGAVLDRWPVPLDLSPRDVHWAKDGRIVYYSDMQRVVLIAARGQASLTGPIALPFAPCEARDWVTPHTLELKERIGDSADCGNSWLLSTDGTNPVRRDGASPAAISPDGRKILLWADGGGVSIADPDSTGEQRLSIAAPPYNPVW